MNRRTFCALSLAALPAWSQADPGAPKPAIERWKDLRFGMFVHWGPVSIVGTEISWSRGGERRGRHEARTGNVPVEVYDNLYRIFNPVKFDPDQWVQLAKDAGMKYLVFTCKHHDGFCNFDSKLTDYRITSPQSPYSKDIVRQIADACHRGGIDWGVYAREIHRIGAKEFAVSRTRLLTYSACNFGTCSVGIVRSYQDWTVGATVQEC